MNKKITLFLGLCLAMAYAEDTSVGVSTSHMYKVNASTDVLGRHNSKVAKTPSAFVATPKTSLVLKKSGDSGPVIEASSGRYEKYKVNGTYRENYWFNSSKMDSATYVLKAAQYDARFANTINFRVGASQNAGTPVYSYTRKKNDRYGLDTYFKDNGNGVLDTFFNIQMLMKDDSLYYAATNKNITGKGIGVYAVEEALPNPGAVSYKPIYTCGTQTNSTINHASKVGKVIKEVAHGTTLYVFGADSKCIRSDNNIFPIRPDLYSPNPIYIGNRSYGTGESPVYHQQSKAVDNYVYNTRVIEVASAGNAAKDRIEKHRNISEVGRGLNVITVGAAKRHKSGKYTYYDETSVNNPRMPATKESAKTKYYDKPEIISPANVFFNKDYTYTYYYDATEVYPPIFGHTSSATPFVVGMIANLLQQKPFYKWHPEVVKALLLTSSILPIASSANQQDDVNGNFNKLVCFGMPSYSAMINGNRSRYWLGNNGDYFQERLIDYGSRSVKRDAIVFEEPNITAGKTYRIAIAWLVNGDSVWAQHAIPQDLDLRVSQEGNSVVEESSFESNPFEMVEFKAKNNKNLTISIIRYNNDGSNRVMLGYNLYEVP